MDLLVDAIEKPQDVGEVRTKSGKRLFDLSALVEQYRAHLEREVICFKIAIEFLETRAQALESCRRKQRR